MIAKTKYCITITLIALIVFQAFSGFAASADTADKPHSETAVKSSDDGYSEYLSKFSGAADAAENIEVAVKQTDRHGSDGFTTAFTVEKSGFYNMRVIWKPEKSGMDIETGIMLDGAYPFDGMKNCMLVRLWENADKNPRKDNLGNEYAQEQKEIEGDIETVIRNSSAVNPEPYKFYLESGAHTVTFKDTDQPVSVSGIIFSAPEAVRDYADVSADYNLNESGAGIITIQAENADIKTSKSIIPKSNNSNGGMTPSDPYKAKINYIGGTTWQNPGDALTWKFNVKTAGYYSVNMRYLQSDLINAESHRILKVNGKVPFTEAADLKFNYSTKWKYYTFKKDDETPYFIWLDEGENSISLEASVGDQADYYYRLNDALQIMGDEYIKIIMITGETPDLNRDYELFRQIPDFTESLTSVRDSLNSISADMKKNYSARSTQFTAAVENTVRVLQNMLDNPYGAQMYLSDYYDNYSSLSSWLHDMNNMPLALDEIQLVPYGRNYVNKNAGFFKQQYYNIVRFISSFGSDYRSDTGAGSDTAGIKLWVNWGQDQASALDALIKESFTYNTGIKVNLQIVNTSLINGLLTGNFPDVSLMMARTEPVNLGMRGALADISQFRDYKEVLGRFADGADTPYWYNGHLYAIPDTQSFFIMFVRTDILKNLGLEIPKTWNEFIHAATIIQRNNMNVYLPYTQMGDASSVNGGLGSLHMFSTLMSQNGLEIYNKSKNATDITGEKVIDVFKYWTDFYKNYSFLKTADFYNRFREGTMPLGISPYTTYMSLYAAAPEIKGRWKMATVPGTEGGNNTVAGAGTGCAIIERSNKKAEAWEFLKWWTSAETQERYIQNVESVLGTISRPTTSNIEAFNELGWKTADLKVLNEQWSLVRELPEIPGSYYLIRSVDQAYWEVVNGESSPRDALVKWGKVADSEIKRKINEYS